VTEFSLFDESGAAKTVFEYGERMKLRLTYEASQPLDNPNFIIAFVRSDGVACCNFSTEADGLTLGEIRGKGVVELHTPPIRLVSELYTISILIREQAFKECCARRLARHFTLSTSCTTRILVYFMSLGSGCGRVATASDWLVSHCAEEVCVCRLLNGK